MQRFIVIVGTLLAVVCLTGCIEVKTVIKVKTDGSGTLEETVLMKKEAIQQLQAMSQMGTKPGEKPKPFELVNETELKEKAKQMGEGVTFVSAKKITQKDKEGVVAVYNFKDIAKLRINPGVADKMAQPPGMELPQGEVKEEIKFQFTKPAKKGAVAKLVINMPKPQKTADDDEGDDDEGDDDEGDDDEGDDDEGGEDESAMMMMQQMFQDMKVVVIVEVDGKIAKSNATHAKGNQITLMEIDFNQVLKNPEAMKQMAKQESQSIDDMKKLVEKIPGIKVELNETVEIQFK